jgi:hypothetical protein
MGHFKLGTLLVAVFSMVTGSSPGAGFALALI